VENVPAHFTFLMIDFGSQFTQLIARRECWLFCGLGYKFNIELSTGRHPKRLYFRHKIAFAHILNCIIGMPQGKT